MATKAQRNKAKLLAKIYLCVLVSWWRKCFATKCRRSALEGTKIIPKNRGVIKMSWPKCMVLDGETRAALGIIRSLGKKGIPIIVGSNYPFDGP